LYGDLLIFTVDGCDVQYVVALDKKTGEIAWKTNRTVDLSGVHYMTRKCFTTPTVYRAGGRWEMIAPGSRALFAYDPPTGKELWQLAHRGWSISPRPIFQDGLLYLVMDFDHPELWAVTPGGAGQRQADAVVWSLQKGAPSTPSFLVIGGMVIFVSDVGIAACLDAKSGETIWRERLEGNYSASPLAADGRVYFFNHDAAATVIEAGREYRQLAVNRLDGEMRASPAVSGKSLLLRTRTHLYRIEDDAR
jgi:outer membrane protein assembly factor BamB